MRTSIARSARWVGLLCVLPAALHSQGKPDSLRKRPEIMVASFHTTTTSGKLQQELITTLARRQSVFRVMHRKDVPPTDSMIWGDMREVARLLRAQGVVGIRHCGQRTEECVQVEVGTTKDQIPTGSFTLRGPEWAVMAADSVTSHLRARLVMR